jgi:hypothetical protein
MTEVPAPTWWRANRHTVLAIAGLVIGLYVGTHHDGTQPPSQAPPAGHTAPSPRGTHTQPEADPTSPGRITIRLFRSER